MAVSKPGDGPHDGWNDPPLFSFNTSAQGVASPRRTLLNKRVSFPLSSGAAAEMPLVPQDPDSAGMLLNPEGGPPKLPPVHILPPSSSISVHPPVPLLLQNLSPPVDHSMLPPSFASAIRDPKNQETLPELLERLKLDSADSLRKYTKRILHEMVDVCKDSIQGRSREDVQARLSLLDDQWRDGKLSEDAQIKLGCLASALKSNDLRQADSLHLSLMVDHISEVSQWMVGVKRLINELKISQMPLPSSSPKKLFLPSETSTTEGNQLGTENQLTAEDLCIDTDKLVSLKPVLQQEDLVQDTTHLEQHGQHFQESEPNQEHLVQHQEQPCPNIVDSDISGIEPTDNR
ncbi:unnamed protein product [Candidula unifasciata]|uniref:SRA1/Sec31 domain-containing protein n=1 Tax=Candidula unifasciata TaxID=100452 RepID=A0A8S4A979_9EUPU|nr:unnamed protein product [Candidula unifasciata]